MRNAELYNKGFVPLHPDLLKTGMQLYIDPKALEFLNDRVQDDYASYQLIKKILDLRSEPRPMDGGVDKVLPTKRQIAIDGILVSYYIESGCVCITGINYNPKAKAKKELAGLHLVKRGVGGWVITEMYVKEVTTRHAAVNGQNNDRQVAASEVMPHHLLNSYDEDNITEFTLFHNPTTSIFGDTYESARDKLGITTPMTKNFAKVLKKTQDNQHEVKWVTHSQGGAIFSQAVHYHNKKQGTPLDKHTVFFQASANNMFVTKRILNKAQVKLHKEGYNNSPVDGVPQIVGANALTDIVMKFGLKSLGRFAISPLSFFPGLIPMAFTGPQFSTHTRPYEGLPNYGKKVVMGVKDMLPLWLKRFV